MYLRLAAELNHVEAQALVTKSGIPVNEALLREGGHGSDVHAARGALALPCPLDHAQQRKLGAGRLAAPRGRRQQHVIVRVVQRREHLRYSRQTKARAPASGLGFSSELYSDENTSAVQQT